ncbi:MAG: hypothetical protein V4726_22780 [Verrucomicrobiota bacterium]
MKIKTRAFLRGLAGAASGFTLGLVLARSAGKTAASGAGRASVPVMSGQAEPAAAPSTSITAHLPEAGTWPAMDAKAKLACSLGLRGASPERRSALLQECLRRAGPERGTLLAILLSEWAETEPAAAMEWALAHPEGEITIQNFHDIMHTWAARHGQGLAEWANAYRLKPPDGPVFSVMGHVLNSLGLHDPVAYANFLEMESNKGFVTSGRSFENSLRTEAEIKSMAARLSGHVAYADNPTEFQRALSQESSARHAGNGTKSGWNELFESTATAWHRMSPAECDAWLSTFPENAQAAARHFMMKARLTRIVEESMAGPNPPEIRSLPRPDAPAPAPESAAGQVAAWGQWWHGEPAAAEAFLNQAAWPDELKFRARAESYATAP